MTVTSTSVFRQPSGLTKKTSPFPDPFLTYANLDMPKNIKTLFDWCEHLWYTNGIYRMALQRSVRHFLTKIEVEDISDEEKEKYDEFLNDTLDVMNVLAEIGDDFVCYGNCFISIYVPFRRYLRCPKCGITQPITEIEYEFRNYKFHGECKNPKCKRIGEFARLDRPSKKHDELRVIRWSPREMQIKYHPISGEFEYYWSIPEHYRAAIEQGDKFAVETCPWEVIETIKENGLFKFDKDVIYHLREPTLGGYKDYGWGIPRVMTTFKQVWYNQVLKRQNEAIALDYILPLRLLTPKAGNSAQADPLLHVNLSQFNSRIRRMIEEHRRDPATWHTVPFPVDYVPLGGDGKALVPADLMIHETDELLNALGVPAEFFKGSLSIQAAPTALRLFERTWTSFVHGLNGFIRWLFNQIYIHNNWEQASGRLQPSTIAEDIERKSILMQLAASKQVSSQTAMAPLGVDYKEEVRRMQEEERFAAEEADRARREEEKSKELQGIMDAKRQEAQQQWMMQAGLIPPPEGGGAPGGGMPPGGGGMMPPMGGGGGGQGGDRTPQEMNAEAEQIAMQLLGMSETQRKSQLYSIKKTDETLHALVRAQMEKIRQQARTQGGEMALQQMVGGGG